MQALEVAIVIEAGGKIGWGFAFDQRQAAVAVRSDGPGVDEVPGADVAQIQHVAGFVVLIILAVADQRIGVAWVSVEPEHRKARGELRHFPAGGADQLIETVMLKRAERIAALVLEVTNRQGLVLDRQNSADRIVLVTQVLQRRRIRQACGQRHQAAILRAILGAGLHAVAGGFLFDLAAGVVANIADQPLAGSGAAGRLQPGVLELSGQGVGAVPMVALGVAEGKHFANGVVDPAAVEAGARLQQRVPLRERQWPVGRVEFFEKMAGFQQRQAQQIVVRHQPGAGRVVMTNQPAALVSGLPLGVTVEKTLGHPWAFVCRLFNHGQRTQQPIVFVLLSGAATVPAVQDLPGQPEHVHLQACIDAAARQRHARQAVNRNSIGCGIVPGFDISPQSRIPTSDQASGRIESLTGDTCFSDLPDFRTAIGNTAGMQTTGVHHRQGRSITVHRGAVHKHRISWGVSGDNCQK